MIQKAALAQLGLPRHSLERETRHPVTEDDALSRGENEISGLGFGP
jgi:hypothetical protein